MSVQSSLWSSKVFEQAFAAAIGEEVGRTVKVGKAGAAMATQWRDGSVLS